MNQYQFPADACSQLPYIRQIQPRPDQTFQRTREGDEGLKSRWQLDVCEMWPHQALDFAAGCGADEA